MEWCDGSGEAAGGGRLSREEEEELETYSSFLLLPMFSKCCGHPAGDKKDTQEWLIRGRGGRQSGKELGK